MAEAIVCKSGIYAITNTVNGKKYIGSAKRLKYRFAEHVRLLSGGRHHSQTLQRSWNKYGPDSFVYSVLEVVADKSNLIEREQYWIDKENCLGKNGYNISPTAGSPLGVKHTDLARKNMSEAHKGKVLPEYQKIKIGLAGKGRIQSKETTAKRVATRMSRGGYSQSKESLEKMVATRRANGGFSHTKEARKIMSDASKRMWETRKTQEAPAP